LAKQAGATEAELKEAMAYGIIAPAGRAKNFLLSQKEKLGLKD
jgi:hypothetical protein